MSTAGAIPEPKDLWARIIGIPAAGIVGGLMSRAPSGEDISLLAFILNSVIVTFIIWQGNRWMVMRMRNWFPTYRDTPKRIAAQFTIGIAGTLLVLTGYCSAFSLLFFGRVPETSEIVGSVLTGLVLTVLISIIYECVYFFWMWKATIIEAEELKRQQVLSQFETLKSQVNPHFLFNSLNTLAGLIEENPERAVNFVQELSKVYRHILVTRDKDTISLEEEMSFLRSYLFLLKMRFGDSLVTEIRIDEKLLGMQLPALAVQQLVENAIKHNVIATGKQLYLTITTDANGKLTVENNVQKKISVEPSSGFGLNSIRHRFHLLGGSDIQITENDSVFRVSIPLLQPARV